MENHFLKPFVKNSSRIALVLLALTLITRMPFLLIKHLSYDIKSYQIVAQLVREGKNVYQETIRYNYPPLWFWIIHAIDLISQQLNVPLHIGIKMTIFLFEFLNSTLIYQAAQRLNFSKQRAFIISLGYVFNPIPILISGYYGQFDPIMIFWLFLAWYTFKFTKNKSGLVLTSLALGISIWLKLIPAFTLPLFILKIKSWKRKLAFVLLSLSPTCLTLTPHLITSPQGVINSVLKYGGVSYWWGYSFIFYALKEAFPSILLLQQLNSLVTIYSPLIVVSAIIAIHIFLHKLQTKSSLLDSIIMILLTIYGSTTGFGIQWLTWIIPFALLRKGKFITYFTLFGFAYVAASFIREFVSFELLQFLFDRSAWNVLTRSYSLPIWCLCLWWLFSKLKASISSKHTINLTHE